MFVETGTGKTMYFNNIIDFLEATEDGFQDIIAKNVGQHLDPATSKAEIFDNDEVEIDGLPDLPEEEYKGK